MFSSRPLFVKVICCLQCFRLCRAQGLGFLQLELTCQGQFPHPKLPAARFAVCLLLRLGKRAHCVAVGKVSASAEHAAAVVTGLEGPC